MPDEAGLVSCDLDSLRGDDVDANIETLNLLFSGSPDAVPQGLLDSILLNAGTALWIAERSDDLKSGVALAREIVASGRAAQWLNKAQRFYSKI